MKNRSVYSRFIKRALDFLICLVAIIILSPILLVIAILVRIKLGSPVLFKQERVGIDEKIFIIYKFRTMLEVKGDIDIKDDHKRLTKFGEFLRAASIDELPELFNILKGDMSIIGPRPLLVKYLPRYNEFQKQRHLVRPGLSGLAQVNGRNAISWDEKFRLDIKYIETMSFFEDVKLIIMSFVKAVKRESINSESNIPMEEFKGDEKH